jgi:photosystem II stability/assembly factor-like uncharacterized protein
MKRILSFLFILIFLSACAPEQIPVPVTRGPTLVPETPTPVSIKAPVVSPPDLTSIRMLDDRNGWGINDTDVLRTDDGGFTWHNVSPANAGALGYAVITYFLDTQNGWMLVPDTKNMLVGTLYRTDDGGATWSSFPAPFGGGVLRFLDPKQGWMMASLGAGAGSMAVAIFQSKDGGANWKQTYVNDPNQPGAGDSLPLGGLKDGITAIDMQTAWVGGVTYAPGVVYLYQTQDSGDSWKIVPVIAPTGYEQAQLETLGPAFVMQGAAYLPVTLSSQNGELEAVYVSHDGGKTWVQTPTLIPFGGKMDFVSATEGFVWTGTDFYVTKDGAQTWTTVTPDVTFGDSFSGMDFVSPTVGFVITDDASGNRNLYNTTDGGATWNILGK